MPTYFPNCMKNIALNELIFAAIGNHIFVAILLVIARKVIIRTFGRKAAIIAQQYEQLF